MACANLASVLGSWHLWVACRQWWWGGGGPRAAQTSSPSLEVLRNAMCCPGGPYLSECLVELMCLVTFVKDISRCCCSSPGRQRLIRSECCPGCRVRQLRLNLHFVLHFTILDFAQISFLAQDILKWASKCKCKWFDLLILRFISSTQGPSGTCDAEAVKVRFSCFWRFNLQFQLLR